MDNAGVAVDGGVDDVFRAVLDGETEFVVPIEAQHVGDAVDGVAPDDEDSHRTGTGVDLRCVSLREHPKRRRDERRADENDDGDGGVEADEVGGRRDVQEDGEGGRECDCADATECGFELVDDATLRQRDGADEGGERDGEHREVDERADDETDSGEGNEHLRAFSDERGVDVLDDPEGAAEQHEREQREVEPLGHSHVESAEQQQYPNEHEHEDDGVTHRRDDRVAGRGHDTVDAGTGGLSVEPFGHAAVANGTRRAVGVRVDWPPEVSPQEPVVDASREGERTDDQRDDATEERRQPRTFEVESVGQLHVRIPGLWCFHPSGRWRGPHTGGVIERLPLPGRPPAPRRGLGRWRRPVRGCRGARVRRRCR